jgi:xanthine dehydrogenase iron-sulfur cluster and FAD-binding subunit A
MKTFRTTLVHDGVMCAIEIPFDPKQEFGKVRAPVTVTLNGHTYRSTIAAMGGRYFIPLRASNSEAAGLSGDETLDVTIALDEEKREVTPPDDFVAALQAAPPAWERWAELSFSHQREYVEAIADAKQAATRTRRIESAVKAIAARPAKKRK